MAVAATVTFPEIGDYLRKKVVQFTFFQNMPKQVAIVVEVLARHLLDGRVPPPLIRIPPCDRSREQFGVVLPGDRLSFCCGNICRVGRCSEPHSTIPITRLGRTP